VLGWASSQGQGYGRMCGTGKGGPDRFDGQRRGKRGGQRKCMGWWWRRGCMWSEDGGCKAVVEAGSLERGMHAGGKAAEEGEVGGIKGGSSRPFTIKPVPGASGVVL
jgi:hypothetical protein